MAVLIESLDSVTEQECKDLRIMCITIIKLANGNLDVGGKIVQYNELTEILRSAFYIGQDACLAAGPGDCVAILLLRLDFPFVDYPNKILIHAEIENLLMSGDTSSTLKN